MSPQTIVGKSILVTGASSGIGKATAKLLAANGARLTVAARSFDRLQSLAQEIDANPVVCDVTSLDSVKKMVEAALRHNGKIDALFANAGIYLSGDVAEGLPNDWSQLIAVQCDGSRPGNIAPSPRPVGRRTFPPSFLPQPITSADKPAPRPGCLPSCGSGSKIFGYSVCVAGALGFSG